MKAPVRREKVILEICLKVSLYCGPREVLAFLWNGIFQMPELLDPFIDENGKRWFDPTSAAEHLHYAATPSTLAKWAAKGEAPFGLPIESKRIPLKMTTRYSENFKPRFPKTDRPVISEDTVNALNAVFTEVFRRKRKHDHYSKDELARLKAAAAPYSSAPSSAPHP